MAVETPRMQQLKKLAGGMPVANQRIAQGLREAQTTQMQAAIGQARPGAGIQQAQQIGAQVAQQQGQAQLQAQQATQQQAQQVGQVGLQQQQLQNTQQLGREQSAQQARERSQTARLNQLDNQLKSDLLDKQMQFARDERGRMLLNDRQMADIAILNARNDQEFEMFKQKAEQVQRRKLQAMEYAAALMENTLKSGYNAAGKRMDQQSQLKIKRDVDAARKAIEKEKRKRENKAAMWGAAGTILGAGAGAIIGGPQGAAAGAQIGGATGTYASTR
jgi:hypothetical protein